jgi:hypothetical protein
MKNRKSGTQKEDRGGGRKTEGKRGLYKGQILFR